jgi:large conductance mechanosensitive channel|tara:strand:- start:39284 stop:39694 length:411 start_codon:yes stop_codon:yes gene_type:complete
MKIFKEFKNFAVKGNMMDMAIGIIIGASFNKVLNIMVKKVLLPPLSYISSGVNLAEKRVILQDAQEGIEEISIQYGELIEAFVDFFVIGLVLFIVVKIMNRIKDKADDVSDLTFRTPKNIQLLSSIEAELKKLNDK